MSPGEIIPLRGPASEPPAVAPVDAERAALAELIRMTLERISVEQHRLARQRKALEEVLRRLRAGEDQGLVRARLEGICPELSEEA